MFEVHVCEEIHSTQSYLIIVLEYFGIQIKDRGLAWSITTKPLRTYFTDVTFGYFIAIFMD